MKKLRVIGLEADKDQLLAGLLPLGCVELSTPTVTDDDVAWSALFQADTPKSNNWNAELSQTKTALIALERYGELKTGMFDARPSVTADSFAKENPVAKACQQTITSALQTLSQLQAEVSRLHTRKSAMLPWEALEAPLEFAGTTHVAYAMAVMPSGTDLTALEVALGDLPVVFQEVSQDKQQVYGTFLYLKAEQEALHEVLRPLSASFVTFGDSVGTVKDNLQAIDQSLAQADIAKAEAEKTIVDQVPQAQALRQQVDWLETQLSRDTEQGKLLSDETVLVLQGWVPAEKLTAVSQFLESIGCAWEASDPVEEEFATVPVKLKSNWFTKPLNMVTEMYSLPAYQGIDPNPLMAPFFILFYGIMMADMGYGLVMMLMGGYILKKAKPTGTMEHLAGLMCLCGVSTFFVGALTGGFFGDFLTQLALILNPNSTFALPALFTPLEDTLMILIGSMALGLVQIITGMAVSFVYKVKHGDVMGAIWEEGTWWMVFLGGGLAAVGITNIVLYISGVMILVGAGWKEKGIGKVTAIFGSLYNHITGYFGDILSYSRLMALMLAGSVIAQVFNTLGAIPGNIIFFLVISFAGNALNLALNLLGCYVHDLRLQCLEYFGKFYQDGGRAFAPLSFKTKYVDIDNNN
ncbi:V-type ATPase 116kDa subunit family protein [Bengtsoniella intestinalis]|uniref:V-type ATP synthase subunit I n=1 Tax=Bengtsoniella intestinalis TaxID=3073143 RepID=UPI00391F48E4